VRNSHDEEKLQHYWPQKESETHMTRKNYCSIGICTAGGNFKLRGGIIATNGERLPTYPSIVPMLIPADQVGHAGHTAFCANVFGCASFTSFLVMADKLFQDFSRRWRRIAPHCNMKEMFLL